MKKTKRVDINDHIGTLILEYISCYDRWPDYTALLDYRRVSKKLGAGGAVVYKRRFVITYLSVRMTNKLLKAIPEQNTQRALREFTDIMTDAIQSWIDRQKP